MRRPRQSSTLATRMVIWITAMGIFVAAGLAALEYRRALDEDRSALQAHVQMAREVVGDLIHRDTSWDGPELVALLQLLKQTGQLRAVRLWDAKGGLLDHPVVAGDWASLEEAEPVIWTVDQHSGEAWPQHASSEIVVYRLPLLAEGHELVLEMVVDGADRQHAVVESTLWHLLPGLVMLTVAALTSRLLMRRWVVRPLRDLASCIRGDDNLEEIDAMAGRLTGVSRQVALAVSDTIHAGEDRLLQTQETSQENEALFIFAPSPLLVMDDRGVIQRANKRAVMMLVGDEDGAVQGRSLAQWVLAEDRQSFLDLLEGLRFETRAVLPLRLRGNEGVYELMLDAQRDSEPGRQDAYCSFMIRVLMQDQSRTLQLHHRLEQHRRLLSSGLNEIPGAVVMTDLSGDVVFHNLQFSKLMQRGSDQMLHAAIDQQGFWAPLVPLSPESFCEKVACVVDSPRDALLSWTEETEAGPLEISAQPICDAQESLMGISWRIRQGEPVPMETAVSPIDSFVSVGLGSVAGDLHEARGMMELLESIVESLRIETGSDAAGIALRAEMPGTTRRSLQLISRGALPLSPELYTDVVCHVEGDMMPEVLVLGQTVSWQEGEPTAWRDVFSACGLGAHVAAPLMGSGEDLGIIWLARREGVALSSQAKSLLDCVARIVAPRLEAVAMSEQLVALGLMDSSTWLPSRDMLIREAARHNGTGTRVAMIVLNCAAHEGFAQHADSAEFIAVSRAWADGLRSRCRRNTFIASLGPGKFGLCVRGLESGFAAGLAQRLCEALRDIQTPPSLCSALSWSGGVSVCNGSTSPSDLLDQALEQAASACQQGGGRVCGDTADRLRRAS